MSELREAIEASINESTTPTPTETAAPEVTPAATEAVPIAAVAAPEGTTTAPVENPVEKPADTLETKVEVKPTVEDKAKPEDPGLPPGEVKKEPEKSVERAAHRVDRPPQSWKQAAKGEWAALPLRVRQEVYRREQEVDRVMQEAAPARQAMAEFQQVVSPYMARINSFDVPPIKAVQELLKGDYMLATAPPQQAAQYMAKLIQDYGINIQELDNALSGAATSAPAAPAEAGLEDRILQGVRNMVGPLMQERQAGVEATRTKAMTEVDEMSLNPAYPHFEEVRGDMSDLITVAAKRGLYLSLDDAYNKAVQLNPDTAAQAASQAEASMAAQQHSEAQVAKGAAVSISGAPASGGATTTVGSGDTSLRGTIEAAMGGLRV